MILQLRRVIDEISAFLNRPHGGMEVELVIVLNELGAAIVLIGFPQAMENTRAFLDFWWLGIPPWQVALPFAVSGLLTVSGIVLTFFGRSECAPLRWAGAIGSILIWTWMGVKTAYVVDWSLLYIITCFVFSLWSIRAATTALSRWHPWRSLPQSR